MRAILSLPEPWNSHSFGSSSRINKIGMTNCVRAVTETIGQIKGLVYFRDGHPTTTLQLAWQAFATDFLAAFSSAFAPSVQLSRPFALSQDTGPLTHLESILGLRASSLKEEGGCCREGAR